MKEVVDYINDLVIKYKYKPLPIEESLKAKELYSQNIPNLMDNKPLWDDFKVFAYGFDRIVIGDYGAFVEISEDKMNLDVLSVPSNQKFRLNKGFWGKYIWLTSDGHNKIYKQIRTVSYADYKIGYYYISPYEIHQI